MQTFDITLYFVGGTPEEALERLPFDSFDSAASYRDDDGGDQIGGNIYSVSAIIQPNTLELVE